MGRVVAELERDRVGLSRTTDRACPDDDHSVGLVVGEIAVGIVEHQADLSVTEVHRADGFARVDSASPVIGEHHVVNPPLHSGFGERSGVVALGVDPGDPGLTLDHAESEDADECDDDGGHEHEDVDRAPTGWAALCRHGCTRSHSELRRKVVEATSRPW